jgi:hypothetical protein
MLSKETLEQYKRMTPSERLHITFQLMRKSWKYMYVGPPEVVRRKQELWELENNLANQRILSALAESERRIAKEKEDGT